jgi:hypothetical protein
MQSIELLILFFFIVMPLFALVEVLRSNFKESTNKIVWVLVIILVPALGAILYYIIGAKQRAIK